MSKRLWLFLCGYLIIRIRGITPSRLFTILFLEELEVWEVRDEGDSIIFHLALRDLSHLEEIGQSIHCSLEVEKEVGLPFYLTSIKERSFFFVGIMVVLLLLYALSSFIWFVELEGLETLEEEDMYHLLGQVGLLPGTYRGQLDVQKIEKSILKAEPHIAWVNVELIGSMACVNILEKTIVSEEGASYLYSKRDAIITKLILLKGKALVEEGDIVLEGDLLITAEDEKEEAVALIEGRTWYEAYGYAPLRERIEIYTGQQMTTYTLRFLENSSIHLLGLKDPPYREYQVETDSYLIYLGRNPYLPIELIKKDFRELLILDSLRTPSMAKTIAQEEALREILQEIGEEGKIIEMKVTLFEEEEGVGVHLVIEVIESIVGEGRAMIH